MLDYLKKVLKLVRPYRFRFVLGVLCGFLSGLLAFTLPLSLKLALDTVFPTEKKAAAFSASDIKDPVGLARKISLKSDSVVITIVIGVLALLTSMTIAFIAGLIIAYLLGWLGKKQASGMCPVPEPREK